MTEPRLSLLETDFDPLLAVLGAGLRAFNAPFLGGHGYHPLRLAVHRAGEDGPAGGLLGEAYGGWLHIRMFWLPEDMRRQGQGSRLLRRAEEWARGKGCLGISLDTFSFQARPFYERHGFTLLGSLADNPPGHARHFLFKRFT